MKRFLSIFEALLIILKCFIFKNLKRLQSRIRTMPRGEATTWTATNSILEWLEQPVNFQLITGGNQQTKVVAGLKLKKIDAYRSLAHHVNFKCGYKSPPALWDEHRTKARYESLLRRYKEVKSIISDVTGAKFCLTEAEVKRGLTLEMKRDSLCPSFSRWDNLFGGRMNLNPVGVLETGDRSDDGISEDAIESQSALQDSEEQVVIGLEFPKETTPVVTRVPNIPPFSSSTSSMGSIPAAAGVSSTTPPLNPVLIALAKDAQAASEFNRSRKKGSSTDFSSIVSQLQKETADSNKAIADERLEFDRANRKEEQEERKRKLEFDKEQKDEENKALKRRIDIEERRALAEEKRIEMEQKKHKKDFVLSMSLAGKSKEEIEALLALLD